MSLTPNGVASFGRRGEVRRQVLLRRKRPLLVVVPTPDSADMVEVLFGHDHKLVRALELGSLDEPFRRPLRWLLLLPRCSLMTHSPECRLADTCRSFLQGFSCATIQYWAERLQWAPSDAGIRVCQSLKKRSKTEFKAGSSLRFYDQTSLRTLV